MMISRVVAFHALPGFRESSRTGTIQLFGLFRDFGDKHAGQAEGPKRDRRKTWGRFPVSSFLSFTTRAQNLSEMPPRTERRPVLSWVSTSPFSLLGWTSRRLRASITASARTGKPKLGNS